MDGRNHISSFLRPAFLGLALSFGPQGYSQCANNNVLYNVNATPGCPGSINVACLWGGEYVLVNVIAGNTYTFSTCGGATWDTQITLYNNAGGGSLGFNDDACGLQSSLTWVATFTGQLRVLLDRYNCANQNTCANLNIQCSSAAPPSGDCIYVLTLNDSWGDGWGTSFVGVSINGGPYQNYTVTGTTNTISFGVMIGQTVSLNYNNSGTFQNENSYSLSIQGAGPLFSSGTPPTAGVVYTQTVDCTPPPAPPQDCVGGTTICSGQSFNNNSNNTGAVADLNASNRGCLASNEQQGTWYYFSPSASGTIGFTIAPGAAIDYDFAVWGPMTSVSCPPLGQPIRCSYASGFSTNQQTGSYNTGLGNGAADLTEGAGGNGWVAPLTVVTGQIYILYVDNFSSTGQSFSLTWQLGGGASLDCTVLPVELISFQAVQAGMAVDLAWSTASERNSDHFEVERSHDGEFFHAIGSVDAAGYSTSLEQYAFRDNDPVHGTNYYRLKQVDTDGTFEHSPVDVVEMGHAATAYPNPTDGLVYLRLHSNDEGPMRYKVRDMYGRDLREGLVATTGNREIQIDISELATGSYMIDVLQYEGVRVMAAHVVRK